MSSTSNTTLTVAQNVDPLSRLFSRPVDELIAVPVLFLVAFFNLITISDTDADVRTELDLQSLIKLTLCGILGLYSVYRMYVDPRMFKIMFGTPGLLLTLVCVLYLAANAVSISPMISLASSLTTSACIWATMAIALQIGVHRLVGVLLAACVTFVLASWLFLFMNPTDAIFNEPLENAEFLRRFGGVSHPNTLGQFSALVIVMLLTWYMPGRPTLWRWLAASTIMLAAGGALILSVSRTSIAALAIAIAFVFRRRLTRGKFLISGVIVATILCGLSIYVLGLTGLGDRATSRVIGLVTKSGTAEEITSGTGRDTIWSESVRLILARPFTGYGAATSKILLADFNRYTHNLFLNVALSAGVVPMALLLLAFGLGFWQALTNPSPVADSLLMLIFANGLMENVAFLVIDSAPLALLTLALVWRSVEGPNGSRRKDAILRPANMPSLPAPQREGAIPK
jgi:O-antigen ligase